MLAVAGAALAGCAPGGATPDGKHVFFETLKPLVGADEDDARDVYERFNGKTTLISQGPFEDPSDPPAQFRGTSDDGKRVFFATTETLEDNDTDDARSDIYMRSGDKTKLISTGPISDNQAFDAGFNAASPDGKTVVFSTVEKLVNEDSDSNQNSVYMRRGSETRLVSPGTSGSLSSFAELVGDLILFHTSASVTGDDGDGGNNDVYSWRDGNYKLVSQGPGENYALEATATYHGASADGKRLFFGTPAPFDGDPDDDPDVYERRGNTTKLISGGGDGDFDVSAVAVSKDGDRVALVTADELTGQDDDSGRADIFVATNGQPKLVSQGPLNDDNGFDAVYAGGSDSLKTVVFATNEKLVGADDDANTDLYSRTGKTTEIVSQGPAGGNAELPALQRNVSADGRTVFFETQEGLVGADEDEVYDAYQHKSGKTKLVSRGPGNTGNEGFDAGFLFASTDGARAFFFTGEKLVAADDAPSADCTGEEDPDCSGYERFRGKTKLFSRGN